MLAKKKKKETNKETKDSSDLGSGSAPFVTSQRADLRMSTRFCERQSEQKRQEGLSPTSLETQILVSSKKKKKFGDL